MPTEQDNPYASPAGSALEPEASRRGRPARTSDGTVLPRHIAAILDNLLAIVLAIAAAKAVGDQWPILQGIVAVLVYFGYYFAFELALARTPGKLLTGLVIVPIDGGRCTWRHTVVRTAFRLLEVNPALFGAAPAALCIVFSRNHQRIGDRFARTIVIPTWRTARRRTNPETAASS